jgi:thiol peroxidase
MAHATLAEQSSAVTMKGNPLTLVGTMPKAGEKAPDFTAVGNDLSDVRLSDYAGKVVVIAAVPSLDTSTCERETRRFNKEASALGPDVQILTLSMDLPFAQKRWCGAEGIKDLRTLSDHRDAQFGKAYGVLIKELRLLARSIFVIDRQGAVRYVQLVKEQSEEPDYAGPLDAARQLVGGK